MPSDFERALRGADEAFERLGLPPEVDRRVRARLRARGAPARPSWRWIAATAAVGLAAAVTWWAGAKPEPTPQPRRLGGFAVASPAAAFEAAEADDGVRLARGAATLVEERTRLRIRLEAPARVARAPSGVRLLDGVARFEAPPSTTPIRVLVSHGELRTLGARFTAEQSSAGGRVRVHAGALELVEPGLSPRRIEAGSSSSWPQPPAERPRQRRAPAGAPPGRGASDPPSPRAPTPVRSPPTEDRAQAVFERLAKLRAQGAYDEAARTLEQALSEPLAPSIAERFSYELGALLTYRLQDTARACAHWQAHLRRFSPTRYDVEIARARARAGCLDKGAR